MKRIKWISVLMIAVVVTSLSLLWGVGAGEPTATAASSVYTRSGDYIYFGSYPQTVKASTVTIKSTTDSRGYYLGSDSAYYAKVSATPYGSNYKFSNNAQITTGTTYYFKVEQIKWRILYSTGSTALLVCDSILDAYPYEIYTNNYENSSIRNYFLNDSAFYGKAFTSAEQGIIRNTTVDNTKYTTERDRRYSVDMSEKVTIDNTEYDRFKLENCGHQLYEYKKDPKDKTWKWELYAESTNDYACANTTDKVFLLSYADVFNESYGFWPYFTNDSARRRTASDYSRASGLLIDTSDSYYGCGHWWLRSPYYDCDYMAAVVNFDGFVDNYYVGLHHFGVVPALWINL